MDCLLAIVGHQPVAFHFSVLNPAGAGRAQLVPGTLQPIGLFVAVTITDQSGEEIYRSERPKQKPKLDPQNDASYVRLEPGYSFGTVFTIDADDLKLRSGRYRLDVVYSNDIFTGPAVNPIGSLSCSCADEVVIP
jgi:hypothetical protein